MEADSHILRFIAGTFPSVWSLELLLQLRRDRERAFSNQELVSLLRASEAVVSKSIRSLLAAGLILEDEQGSVRYGPASIDLEADVEATEQLYRGRPDAVRRLIVRSSFGALAAFADAFKLRGKND